jgi:FAD/FMN-containing dehydrogenase
MNILHILTARFPGSKCEHCPLTNPSSQARKIAAALRPMVPGEGVIEQKNGRRPYETDGLTGLRPIACSRWLSSCPRVSSRRAVLTYCDENNVKVVARGAGTSLSGGALPLEDGVLVSMMKFNKINEPMRPMPSEIRQMSASDAAQGRVIVNPERLTVSMVN